MTGLKYKLLNHASIKKLLLLLLTAFVISISVMPASADNTTNNTINSTSYNISIFDRSFGADVTRNPEINNNIPRTNLSTKILENQKQGSTKIRFGNGNGNRLLIWSGIHGNEEEANIATMRYIEYLNEFSKGNVLNGTIYVIPFGIPKSTSINSRNFTMRYTEMVRYRREWYTRTVTRWVRRRFRVRGRWRSRLVRQVTRRRAYRWIYRPVTRSRSVDPNRVANVTGTPGWKAVEFARNNGIRHILDVHSGGGLYRYRNGLIFATTNRAGERSWAEHVRNKTNCTIYYGPGMLGMVRRHGHRYRINTITLEVERDRGCTAQWANILYRMVRASVNYLFPALRP